MTSINNKTVSSTFRALMKEFCPKLGENPAYWNFLGVLLFGMRESESKKILIPRELIAICEGNEYLTDDKNYVAEKFLKKFKEDVNSTLEWSNWSYVDGKCRVVDRVAWSPEIVEAVKNERNKVWKDSGRVYLMDGTPWNLHRQREIRDITYAEVIKRMEWAKVEIAKKLLEYMNSLPVLTFSRLEKNMPYAEEVARKQADADNQLDLLRAIEDEFKPFYQPTKKSVRIFPFSLGLKRLSEIISKKPASRKNWSR